MFTNRRDKPVNTTESLSPGQIAKTTGCFLFSLRHAQIPLRQIIKGNLKIMPERQSFSREFLSCSSKLRAGVFLIRPR
jgi:hypothetical protein